MYYSTFYNIKLDSINENINFKKGKAVISYHLTARWYNSSMQHTGLLTTKSSIQLRAKYVHLPFSAVASTLLPMIQGTELTQLCLNGLNERLLSLHDYCLIKVKCANKATLR
ncbi:hypothetical protein J6590_009790 [Homalodisca vitripennis]|nr:hypothetical protein J6590_009790 [Homalodisca vitripennis]